MSVGVFLAVIGAAILHAGWNALVKGGADKRVAMAGIVLGGIPFAAAAILVAPLPARESWPLLAGSVTLHLGYQWFLMASYRIGDLTQVYPLARGSAPLIVAGVSVAFLGVTLAPVELAGIVVIATGILSLALARRADGLPQGRAALFALATGGFIAAYSLVDGMGARLAGTSLGFYGWAALLNGLILALWLAVTSRGTLRAATGPKLKLSLAGGGASFAAYAIVTWAFTQAPIALVTALRETSIVAALLIGVFLLGERLSLARAASIMTTLIGVALLRLARP